MWRIALYINGHFNLLDFRLGGFLGQGPLLCLFFGLLTLLNSEFGTAGWAADRFSFLQRSDARAGKYQQAYYKDGGNNYRVDAFHGNLLFLFYDRQPRNNGSEEITPSSPECISTGSALD